MTTSYVVRSRARTIRFDGVLLAHVSSRREDSPRWVEMSIYKTISDQFVLEKIGRSIVTHMPTCQTISANDPPLPRFQDEHPGADPDEEFEYHDCVPDPYDFTQLVVEIDRNWGVVSADPQKIINEVRLRKGGRPHLPEIAQELLNKVSRVDTAFDAVWNAPRLASA